MALVESDISLGKERGSSEYTASAGVRMPLNSRQLKHDNLWQLAAVLGLPATASGDKLCQMIDRKLTEGGKDTRIMQVILAGGSSSEVFLEDVEGRSLAVQATGEGSQREPSEPSEQDLTVENNALKVEVSELGKRLCDEKSRFRDMWHTNCQCLAEYDQIIMTKDVAIEELNHQLCSLTVVSSLPSVEIHSDYPEAHGRGETNGREAVQVVGSRVLCGKAPPVDPFTGEDSDICFDKWLPPLEQAQVWNDWMEEELLLQLAGHLCGRAIQEWGLLNTNTKKSYSQAIKALRLRLDPGSRTVAAQDFRHTVHVEEQKVVDFLRRLKRTLNITYGRKGISVETRDTLQHGQIQDGLKDELMTVTVVSGAESYKALCLAARNEEKQVAELKKKQHYLKPSTLLQPVKKPVENKAQVSTATKPSESNPIIPDSRKCVLCHKPGHLQL